MLKRLAGIFVICWGALIFGAFGAVDNREYVDWANYPQIVHLKTHINTVDDGNYLRTYYGQCTGQYIAPNLILTAAHCIKDDNGKIRPGGNFAVNYKKKEFPIKLLYSPEQYKGAHSSNDPNQLYDWAVFIIESPDDYSQSYYSFEVPNNSPTPVYNAGFGWMTKLSNQEISNLHKIFINYRSELIAQGCSQNSSYRMNNNECIDTATGQHVVFTNLDQVIDTNELYDRFEKSLGRSLEDRFTEHKLKADYKCTLTRNHKDIATPKGIVITDCDAWEGNSGGPFVNRSNTKLLATITGGAVSIISKFADDDYSGGVATEAFFDKIQELARNNPPKQQTNRQTNQQPQTETPSVVTQIAQNIPGVANVLPDMERLPGLNPESILSSLNSGSISSIVPDLGVATQADIKDLINGLDQDITNSENAINTAANNPSQVVDSGFLHQVVENTIKAEYLKKIKQAYEKYQNTKGIETSYANRMLGGVTMAATGIGGMELAQGLAEQKADEAADRDMQAYMATFQCKIGNKGGKTYTGGTKGIEVPGANQLIDLYQEYVNLAADLKQRKESLGMRPGIESEVVLNKANMGLYSDEAIIEKRNGTYASIYRAATGNETDAEKLQEQRDTSAKRADVGGKVGVGGAAGGLVGNVLLNHVNGGKWGAGASGTKSDSNILEKGAGIAQKLLNK